MSLNLSAHFQRNTPKQASTITNQIIVNPTSSQAITSESSLANNAIQPVTYEPSAPPPSSTPLCGSGQSPPSLTPYPSLQMEEKTTKFKLILLEILQNLFANEMSLLKNIIEPSKNIILKVEDLYRLICILCDTQQVDIISSPVVKGCSCSDTMLHANIDRIVVNGYDLMIAYNSAFNTLRSNHISLEHVIPSSSAL
jgi:hypothetical protein